MDAIRFRIKPDTRAAVHACLSVRFMLQVPERIVGTKIDQVSVRLKRDHGIGKDRRDSFHVRIGFLRNELAFGSAFNRQPRTRRVVGKLRHAAVEHGQLARIRTNGHGRFRVAVQLAAQVFIIDSAAQVECFAELEPSDAVLDSLPRFFFRAWIGVVSALCVHKVGRPPSQRALRRIRQRPHRWMGEILAVSFSANHQKQEDAGFHHLRFGLTE